MKVVRLVQVVDTHTAGEPTRVVVGGLSEPPGRTMEQRRQWLASHSDELRQFLVQEPRGHLNMFGAIVTTPTTASADLGLIFFDSEGYLGMCGHGTIGAITALAATGQLTKRNVTVDTPSGCVSCRLSWRKGEPVSVAFRNVPSFVVRTVVRRGLQIPISYGGNLFALVDADQARLRLEPDALPDVIRTGLSLRRWLNSRYTFRHPVTGTSMEVQLVEFLQESKPPRSVVVFGEGQVDRSPCGTGTSARMALLHSQGRLSVGEAYRQRGILGTEFRGRILSLTTVGETAAVIPEVTGSAFVTGVSSLVLTKGDPFPRGFRLTGE